MPHSILVACINCAIGILPTGLVSALPQKEAGVGKPPAAQALPHFSLSLVHGPSGVVICADFVALAMDGERFRSEQGVWLCGSGSIRRADGAGVCEDATIDLRLRIGPMPSRLIEAGEHTVAFFGTESPVTWVQFGGAPGGGTAATVVSLVRQSSASVHLDGRLAELLDLPSLAALLAEIHRTLTDQPDDRAAVCSPTLAECYSTAVAACGSSGIQSWTYRCSSDGDVECSFTCKSTPG